MIQAFCDFWRISVYRQNVLSKIERLPLIVHANLCEAVGMLYMFPTLTRTQVNLD